MGRSYQVEKSQVERLIKKSVFHGFATCAMVLRRTIEWTNSEPIPSNIPPISDPILLKSAGKISSEIRKGKLTCEQVVRAYLARIKVVNPIINAFCQIREEEAIREAKILDSKIQKARMLNSAQTSDQNANIEAGDTGVTANGHPFDSEISAILDLPLLGVPITIKNSIAVEGCIQDAAIPVYAGRRAPADSVIVQRLRKAGCIVLGITNVPEGLAFWETANKVYGATNNPYDLSLTPAGSSGGEAAAISSGCSLLGIGTDMAGSVRLPAASCGVYGHKISCHSVDLLESMFPEMCPQLNGILVPGPLARYVDDLIPVINVIAENDEVRKELNSNWTTDYSDITIYMLDHENNGDILADKPSADVNYVLEKSAAFFQSKYGCQVQKISLKNQRKIPGLMISAVRANFGKYFGEFFDPNYNVFWELVNVFTLTSKYKYFSVFMTLFDWILSPSEEIIKEHEIIRKKMKATVIKTLGPKGVLFMPTLPDVALKHDTTFTRFPDCSYSAFFNCLELPATHVPMGVNRSGLPIGFQIGTIPNNDYMGISMAKELSRHFYSWIPPCPVKK